MAAADRRSEHHHVDLCVARRALGTAALLPAATVASLASDPVGLPPSVLWSVVGGYVLAVLLWCPMRTTPGTSGGTIEYMDVEFRKRRGSGSIALIDRPDRHPCPIPDATAVAAVAEGRRTLVTPDARILSGAAEPHYVRLRAGVRW